MGEYAEMMLDGTCCEGCGTYIDDAGGDGVPRYCSNQCARDRGALHALPNATTSYPNPKKTNCTVCGKRLKKTGLADHMRDAHDNAAPPKMPDAAQMWAFVQQVARLTHSEDPDGLIPGIECDDSNQALDGLIHKARAIAAPVLA